LHRIRKRKFSAALIDTAQVLVTVRPNYQAFSLAAIERNDEQHALIHYYQFDFASPASLQYHVKKTYEIIHIGKQMITAWDGILGRGPLHAIFIKQ
jgi:hypothetical protein